MVRTSAPDKPKEIPKNLIPSLLQTRAGQNAVSWREMAQPRTHGTPWTLEFGFISYFPLRDPSSPLTLPLLMKGVARNSPQHSEEPQRHWYLGNKQPESCPSWLLSTWYKLNHLRGENIKWENASVGAVCRQAYEAHFLEWWSMWSGTLRVVLHG